MENSKGLMPKYTKLKDMQGRIAPSDLRPEIPADYFEQQQFGGVKTPAQRESDQSDKYYRNNLLFDSQAEMVKGDYTIPELKKVIKKVFKK